MSSKYANGIVPDGESESTSPRKLCQDCLSTLAELERKIMKLYESCEQDKIEADSEPEQSNV